MLGSLHCQLNTPKSANDMRCCAGCGFVQVWRDRVSVQHPDASDAAVGTRQACELVESFFKRQAREALLEFLDGTQERVVEVMDSGESGERALDALVLQSQEPPRSQRASAALRARSVLTAAAGRRAAAAAPRRAFHRPGQIPGRGGGPRGRARALRKAVRRCTSAPPPTPHPPHEPDAPVQDSPARAGIPSGVAPPPPPSRTNWTSLVPPPY
jgi:hypothetical protein